ncbi:hypothetical protein [Desulfatitalea alkaliphila]|uniref:Uncharacterized protein n=1 Tax=Desulfatitalea alkaliphila TaxID=2929485 RepID=A0AA41R2G3_9BACT|nr:hypothetical protein [Desulfatitalea alkaliphila]MCJ8500859.1 hypothetical protein [Desulfatitalea alkaliphila]
MFIIMVMNNHQPTEANMPAALKSERITILGTSDFKAYLFQEAKKEGISVSELVRQRCEGKSAEGREEAEVLADMVKELQNAVTKAEASLNKGLKDAAEFLEELRKRRSTDGNV